MNQLKNMMKPEQYFLRYRKRLTRFGTRVSFINYNVMVFRITFFEDYLLNRNQRVILNGLESTWRETYAGVPQGSVLVPLLFLVYINDLPGDILSEMRLFADDSSVFTGVNGIDDTQGKIEKDLSSINIWAYQWKMIFNPDMIKQAEEVIFSVKNIKPIQPTLTFNNVPVARVEHTKHLGST